MKTGSHSLSKGDGWTRSPWRADGLLLLTAAIWGFAFVAQRAGMAHVGPFTFNAVRFALGALVLIPLLACRRGRSGAGAGKEAVGSCLGLAGAGGLAGTVLFVAAALQQVGMTATTAGKGGFITGLYVVIVPLWGLFAGHQVRWGTWLGATLAAMGLYLLSVTGRFTMEKGDFLVLLSAFFWAAHIMVLGRYAPRFDPLRLSVIQFSVCAAFSGVTALLFETVNASGLAGAAVPILYAGIGSIGIAYTLQVVAQRWAHPAHASILLCMESPFSALGGWWILGEVLTPRALAGGALMLVGMLAAQWGPRASQPGSGASDPAENGGPGGLAR